MTIPRFPAGRPFARGSSVLAPLAVLSCLAISVGVLAASTEYRLDLPDGQRVHFEVPLDVRFDGSISVRADWPGDRILTLRVEGPEGVLARRGGPSPIELEIDAAPEPDGSPRRYVLHIAGLPAGGAASGHLSVSLPEDPAVVAAREEAERPPPPPPPEPEPWMIAVGSPDGARADVAAWFSAIERLRDRIVDERSWETGVDACRWQEPTLQYLVRLRGEVTSRGDFPSLATRRYLRELGEAVDAVESFRTTQDPILAGPIPTEPRRRHLWLGARERRVEPLERRLDRLLDMLQDGFVPELESEEWPLRFVSCLTACQRHFDAVVVQGPDNAGNAQLAEAQWERILAAGAAFSATAALSATAPPTETRAALD